MTEAGYLIYTPPLRERFARLLGFRPAPHPMDDQIEWEGKDVVHIRTDVRLSFGDRLRVLISGKLSIASITKTSELVGRCETLTNVSVPLWSPAR